VSDRPGRTRWRGIAQHAIGPAILLGIFASIDLAELRDVLFAARPGPLSAAALLALPPVVLRTFRWRRLLGPLGERVSFPRLLVVYAHAIFVGSVTPGRIGEFIKVVQITKLGSTRGEALSSVFLDRLFDLLLLAVVAAAGGWGLAVSDGAVEGVLTIAIVLAAALGWGAWRFVYHERFVAARQRLRALLPPSLQRHLEGIPSEVRAAVASLDAGSLAMASGLTAGAWAITYGANYYAAVGLGLDIGYFEMAVISALCSLAALLPISILGAGTRDAVLIVVLARHGATPAQAVALSTLFLSLTLWVALVCGASRLAPSNHEDS